MRGIRRQGKERKARTYKERNETTKKDHARNGSKGKGQDINMNKSTTRT